MPYWDSAEVESGISDAFRLASLGLYLIEDDAQRAAAALRRSAELFEWLSIEVDSDEYPFLSALLYQVAGYPAIARTVGSEYLDDFLWQFARGDVQRATESWLKAAELLGEKPDLVEERRDPSEFFTRSFISAAGVVLGALRWGDDGRVKMALEMLDDVSTFFHGAGDRLSWLLAALFSRVASRFVRTSLREACAPLTSEASPSGRAAFERYFRESYAGGRVFAWPSQVRGIQAIVSGGDFAMCTPTGSGKTTVAELAIMQALFAGSGSFLLDPSIGRLVLYIVPSRALAFEVERRLRRAFSHAKSFPVQVISSYGGSDVSPLESWFESQRATVLVCTQEKADALLRSQSGAFLGRLSLLVVDEAHSIIARGDDDFGRPFRLESLVARIRSIIPSDSCRAIALSAVLPDASELARWIGGDGTEALSIPYRSTRQALGRLNMSVDGSLQVQYDMLNGMPLGRGAEFRPTLHDFIPRFAHVTERSTSGPEVRLRALSLWVAANLADLKRPESGAVLITVGSQINYFSKDFINLCETWDDLPVFFDSARARLSEIYSNALAACSDYFGTASYEYRLLERGIVVHHGKLPLRMAQLFTQSVDRGMIRIVVATSTLSEGINLPFETILFPSLRGVAQQSMSPDYVKNVIGRAGRPGFAREGRALVLTGSGKAFLMTARRYRTLVDNLSESLPAVPPKSALGVLMRRIYDLWSGASGSTDFDEFCSWLEQCSVTEQQKDPETGQRLDEFDSLFVAALAEITTIGLTSVDASEAMERLAVLWNKTFLHAVNPDSRYRKAFINRGKAVYESYRTDVVVRRSYRTGLGPRSAAVLIAMSDEMRRLLRRGFQFRSLDENERLDFIAEVLEGLLRVSEFDFRSKLKPRDPPWKELLRWWIGMPGFQPEADKVGRWYSIANEAFAYRFSWAINSAINSLLPFEEVLEQDAPFAERLAAAGLPFLVLWFRDMMANGCADPIQAAVYGEGLSVTRDEARVIAQSYYASEYCKEGDAAYEPQGVLRWIASVRARGLEAAESDERSVAVSLVAPTISAGRFRVLPARDSDGSTIWRDLSGYPIARSEPPCETFDRTRWDYELAVAEKLIHAKPYL